MSTNSSPLISATDLAVRWDCHISTIARKVKAGIIKPVFRSGPQMSFSMSDVLRVEAGLMPLQRGVESLTEGQKAALSGILTLLGLEQAELTPGQLKLLCDRFYSMPYEDRKDGRLVSAQLEVAMLCLRAGSRAESLATIAGSPALIETVKDMQAVIGGLLPVSQRGQRGEDPSL
jgi:hypothetical protein